MGSATEHCPLCGERILASQHQNRARETHGSPSYVQEKEAIIDPVGDGYANSNQAATQHDEHATLVRLGALGLPVRDCNLQADQLQRQASGRTSLASPGRDGARDYAIADTTDDSAEDEEGVGGSRIAAESCLEDGAHDHDQGTPKRARPSAPTVTVEQHEDGTEHAPDLIDCYASSLYGGRALALPGFLAQGISLRVWRHQW